MVGVVRSAAGDTRFVEGLAKQYQVDKRADGMRAARSALLRLARG